MSKINIYLLPPECHVCGQEVHPKFLKPWNGVEVCKYCIQEINEEAERYYASSNSYHG